MMQTVFRSEDLPVEERLASFSEINVSSEHPMSVVSDAVDDFRAMARVLDLAAVNVVEVTSSPSDALRTPELIRRADPELWSVVVPLSGSLMVSQAGREAMLSTQQLTVYDSSQPFRLRIAPYGGTTRLVRAHMPRDLFGMPATGTERLLARPLPAHTGLGALLKQFLTSLTTYSSNYQPSDLPRLGTVAQDLLIAFGAHHIEAEADVPDDSRRRTLLLRVETFIEQHLTDPHLSPGDVAAAHHISVSYVHRLFRARDTTLSAWIRQRRLEHARRELTDPEFRDMPVSRIAAHWGFKDHATFTRAFRSAFGTSPRDYRHNVADMPPLP